MYLEAHLIPTENNTKDEWIINLHLQDGTKIEAKIMHGYKQTVAECKRWSEELNNCPYNIGGINYNERKEV
tara:strand:+ start:179 stop:391 length:213 start_codon:yes stop_codon:yes gene_type:complete